MKIELLFEVVWSGNMLYPKAENFIACLREEDYSGWFKGTHNIFKDGGNKYGRFTYRLKPVIKWKIN